ncbi:hypothetical protein [Gordonia sp. N1V]|uniref:putative phage holin n=1 Tax=Gordonia sp. N1V TaxID=3034163 RepID=UPI0023E26052|nr:hypothetical protein [Gordonia sp. N1V]MDF3280496.1 hypothetical protein [Gordonia sp. N1V]
MTLADLDPGDYAIFAWTILQIVFTVLYGLRSRWIDSPAGRILFGQSFGFSVALTQVSVTLLTDSGYYARDIIRPIAYYCGVVGALIMLILLVKMQRKDRR